VFLLQLRDTAPRRLVAAVAFSRIHGGQMKRSEQVTLAVMGVAAFAATFVSANAYLAGPATMRQQAAQNCAPRPDGTQVCERRGFAHYFIPSYVHGWWSARSAGPNKTHGATALTSNARSSAPVSATGVVRGGFGSTSASAPFRVSAGG
jgi:hypothetical protein